MINYWHNLLQMKKFDKTWHENDLADELAEYYEETKILKKWSELSDVVYTCTRGRWAGYEISFPFSKPLYYLGIIYMIPKYTDRWLFFRHAGRKLGAVHNLHEVRNPKKTYKLHVIAERNGLDKEKFQHQCEKQLKFWPLLP